jgi:hypothetical protein
VSTTYIAVILFLGAAVVALIIVWFYARRVKGGIESSGGPVAGARVVLELTPDTVTRLRELSDEPILLKQGEEGVRVQIEHRPMLPLMAFVGQGAVSAALNESAARVSEQWGPKWVALINAREDGTVSVQRLA